MLTLAYSNDSGQSLHPADEVAFREKIKNNILISQTYAGTVTMIRFNLNTKLNDLRKIIRLRKSEVNV